MGAKNKNKINPMQAFQKPLCGAHCRTTNEPCKNSPMQNGRCRMHGGKSTGRPITTGLHTKETKEIKKQIKEAVKQLKEML